MGVQQLTGRPGRGPFGVLDTLSPEMARDFRDVFSLVRIGARSGSQPIRITKRVMDSPSGVRTSIDGAKTMGVQPMTTRPEQGPIGLLETLSPELAKDLGDAFSLARIGSAPAPRTAHRSGQTARGALRLAGRVAVFVLVAAVAVSLTVTAMYLMPLP